MCRSATTRAAGAARHLAPIPRGSVVGIMGQSGCGKTTTLRIIMGALPPDRRQRRRCSATTPARSTPTACTRCAARWACCSSSARCSPTCRCSRTSPFPLREHLSLPEELVQDLVMMKLHAVGLRGAAHLMPTELSGGMARRVALARSIALDPQLMLYDEPFTGLDRSPFGVIVRLIRELNDSLGATSVIVTHDVQEALDVVGLCLVHGRRQGDRAGNAG
jgi:phospholipid/cholesterol/gamma-HCH transport system ATP-binding protein